MGEKRERKKWGKEGGGWMWMGAWGQAGGVRFVAISFGQ